MGFTIETHHVGDFFVACSKHLQQIQLIFGTRTATFFFVNSVCLKVFPVTSAAGFDLGGKLGSSGSQLPSSVATSKGP